MAEKKKIIRATTIPMSLDAFCNGMLRELSNDYDVVALSSPDEMLTLVGQREGVRTIGVKMERHMAPLKDIVSLWKLIMVFRKEKPDIVHSMTPKAGLLCMMAAWITRVRVRIHTFTGLVWPTAKGMKRKILMMTDKLTCACATHVIPEGEGVKNDLLNYGITRKPIQVLGYGNVRGVDMDYYDKKRVEGQYETLRDDGFFTFLFVGRIVGDKGINELVKAFNRMQKQYENVRLWLVGNYEDNLDPITQESRDIIDTDASIIAHGPKYGDDLLAYYASADCFVFPSYREGFPNTVLEAGAMELPCIVTDINGSREIISGMKTETGKMRICGNGVIIPSKDENALFESMAWILENKEAAKEMGKVARTMIGERYEQGYVRKCLYDFYKTLL